MQENVIKISDILNHRYDPYYYSVEFIELKKQLQKVHSVHIGSIIESWNRGDGPREGYYTENKEMGVPFIRINNLSNHSVTMKDIKYITREIHNTKLKRTQISPNDLIFAISGTKDNLGTVSIVPDTIKEANLNSALVKLNLFQDKVIPMYFCYLFDLDLIRKQINYIGKGAAQNNLNNNEISEIIIPLPSKEKQKYIIDIMDNANSTKYQKLKNADDLLASIDDFVLIFHNINFKQIPLSKEKSLAILFKEDVYSDDELKSMGLEYLITKKVLNEVEKNETDYKKLPFDYSTVQKKTFMYNAIRFLIENTELERNYNRDSEKEITRILKCLQGISSSEITLLHIWEMKLHNCLKNKETRYNWSV